MEKNYNRYELESKKLVELKEILKSLNLPSSGNKNILIDRIINYQNASFNQANYISKLPGDIQRQTFYSLPYPDVKNICRKLNICDDKFWGNYIQNYYFINPKNTDLPGWQIADMAHDYLLQFWQKNIYPSWRVLPFIFEVLIPNGKKINIQSFPDNKILPFFQLLSGRNVEDLTSTDRGLIFWEKEISETVKSFKNKIDTINHTLKETEKPTNYWTPDGLKDLNFDIDIYYTIATERDHDIDIDVLHNYFKIIIFKKFGFI